MIVIGAGIIGLSCAWTLARAGLRITVFDRAEAAREATWAGAGMLAPGGEFDADSELARMAIRSLSLYPAFIHDLEQESGLRIDFRHCGGTEVALCADEAARIEEAACRRAELGLVSETASYRGYPARFYPGDAVVDPRQIAQALLIACRRHGVAVRENEPVIRIAEHGQSVETPAGMYEDEGVLIAAGAWSSGLYPGLPQTEPVRGHLVAWQMAPDFLGSIVRHNGTYILQRSSGLVIAGSSTEHAGYDRSLDEAVLADIERRAAVLLPELGNLPPVDRWNGLRPAIQGDTPLIGRVPGTAVLTAFGHYRNGILLAPETARLVELLTR